MLRDAQQILLDRLLARAAVAKIPLTQLLSDKERSDLAKIQRAITPDTKKDRIPGIDPIIEKLGKGLNTPEIATKIKTIFLKEGAISQTEALNFIHPQDPKLVIPVIARTIEDLLDKVSKRKVPSRDTVTFVEAALKKVKEVDEKQNRNKASQVSLLRELTKENIRADMAPLLEAINKITFLEEEALAWFEAILWIEGHFLREHTKALVKGNGALTFTKDDEVVAPIDEEDEMLCQGKGVPFWSGTGTTKHFINSHFHAMAVLLERKAKIELKLNFGTIDVFPTRIVEASPIIERQIETVEQKELQKSKAAVPAPAPMPMPLDVSVTGTALFTYKTSKTPDGHLRVTAYLPAETPQAQLDEFMPLFFKAIRGEAVAIVTSPRRSGSLLDRLRRIIKQPQSELFSLMKDAFGECALTGREDSIIHNYVNTMSVYVNDNYINSKTTVSGYWPTVPLKERAHKGLVDALFDEIKRVDDTGKRKSALEIIALVEKTWLAAKEKQSGKLHVVLENLMRNLCEHFIINLDDAYEEKKSAHAAGRK